MIVAKLSAALQPEEIAFIPFKKYKILQILRKDFYWIPSVPMISVLVFIICLIRIASMSLEALYKEIFFRESAFPSEMHLLILKWRKSYILVRDVVAEMNAFFGQPIIIVVFITTLSSINLTFAVIHKIKMNNFEYLFGYIMEIVTNFDCLTLLAFISEQIPQQVSWAKSFQIKHYYFNRTGIECKIRFQKLPIDCNTWMHQTASFKIRQVLHIYYLIIHKLFKTNWIMNYIQLNSLILLMESPLNSPRISAAGFFNVGLDLIPTVNHSMQLQMIFEPFQLQSSFNFSS